MSYGIFAKNLGKIKEVRVDLKPFTLITGNDEMKTIVRELFVFAATVQSQSCGNGVKSIGLERIWNFLSLINEDTEIECYSQGNKFLRQKGFKGSAEPAACAGRIKFVEIDCRGASKDSDIALLVESFCQTQMERGYVGGIYWVKNPEKVIPAKHRTKFIGELASITSKKYPNAYIVVETECPLVAEAVNLAIAAGVALERDERFVEESKVLKKIAKSGRFFSDCKELTTSYLLKKGRAFINIEDDEPLIDLTDIWKNHNKTVDAIDDIIKTVKNGCVDEGDTSLDEGYTSLEEELAKDALDNEKNNKEVEE